MGVSREKAVNFLAIEKKWQSRWEKAGAFEVKEDKKKKKFYILEMFPYPSASGLHVGHAFNYVIGDIYARYKRMNGFNVLHPMGYDSFGLPAENAAIKSGVNPKKYTEEAIKNFIRQQKSLGISYDWSRIISSHKPEYYKWNQFFFLKLMERGLVYRKKSPVNFCEKCNSVLANEQVHNGKCWRHTDAQIKIKPLEQWFIKTTDYADELLVELKNLDWPERIKAMQRNWIGKSEGAEIIFKINNQPWNIFTTRPDTLFGVTFMVVSAQHPRLDELIIKEKKSDVEKFLKKLKSTKQEDADLMEKGGVFTGSYAIHPLTNQKIPIWVGNFVVADYGSGMVMAVPAHDQRDFEFAQKYKIPIKVVIKPEGKDILGLVMDEAYTEAGKLINSEGFNELFNEEAKEHITKALEFKKLGKSTVQYKLRDWLISRQRYWGTPIPVIYCSKCGIVPVPERDLPIKLPDKVKFGKGNPLAGNKSFIEAKCPECYGKARRETDTMDTFFDSSWYYLRFCDAENKKEPFDRKKTGYWMPVDQYIGGAEHACMHLIYARLFTKALRDSGFVKFNEPFIRLFNQGMIHGENGAVMSKSLGNVVDPLEISKKYGADALRLFLISVASPDKDFTWSLAGIEGSWKFVKKVHNYLTSTEIGKTSERVESKIHKTLREVSENIENFGYNYALIKIRALFDSLENKISKEDLSIFLKIISPFCPHIAEEFWERAGNKGLISLSNWPKADVKKINDKFDKADEAMEKVLSDITNIIKIVKEKQGKEIKKVYLYAMPNELEMYDSNKLGLKLSLPLKVFAVNDKKKYDPQGKAGKAKPGKPAIFAD